MKRLVWVVTLILLLALGVMNVWMINYIAELKQEYAKYRGVLFQECKFPRHHFLNAQHKQSS